MADLGFLGALGQGASSAVESYRSERAYQDKKKNDETDRALKKRMEDITMLEKGLTEEGGKIGYTPAKQAEVDFKEGEYDPMSPISGRARESARGLLEQTEKGMGGIIQDQMSKAEIDAMAKEGLIGKTLSGMYGERGRAMTAQRVNDRNEILRQGLDLRRDNQSSHAADTIHKDPQIEAMNNQINLIDRGREILSRPGLTNQEFNDVQIELSNAIAGARSAALGKLERTEYESLGQEWAALKQKVTGRPQDAVPPELAERVKSLADMTRAAMQKHRAARATALSRTYHHNPEAQAEMDKAVKTYTGDSGGGLLKDEGNNKVKVSNGTQTLLIDPADVADAARDGFQVVK